MKGRDLTSLIERCEAATGGDRELLMRFAEAYDTEDAAQRGEPSPWRDLTVCVEDVAWAEGRIACALAGFAAISRKVGGDREK